MWGISKRTIVGLALFGLVVAVAAPASAAPWSNSNGSGTGFSWTNGHDDNGLYGSPLLSGGNTFVFFPSNYRAESIGAGAQSTEDRMEVTITLDPGFTLTAIQVVEFGDFELTGENASVQHIATIGVDELAPLNRNFSAPLNNNFTAGSGTWESNGTLDVSAVAPGITEFTLALDSELIAIAGAGEIASIEKSLSAGQIQITLIPEPATLALLGIGGLAAIRRRRA